MEFLAYYQIPDYKRDIFGIFFYKTYGILVVNLAVYNEQNRRL